MAQEEEENEATDQKEAKWILDMCRELCYCSDTDLVGVAECPPLYDMF